MQITRLETRPSLPGTSDHFTGTTRREMLFQAPAPGRVSGSCVTFEPRARTRWHTHPLGQILIIVAGVGRVQVLGQPIQEVRQGDVVWFAPGEKHWHGAGLTTAMSHYAITEALDGSAVEWMEPVTDAQYDGG